jgi:hypothetical protein
MATMMARSARPKLATRFCVSRRQALGRPLATTNVGDQIYEDVDGRHDQHAALDEQDVSRRDCADQHAADPGPLKHGFDIDRAAQHESGFESDNRDDVHQCIAKGVLVDDAPLAQSLGARRAHVILAHHVEHVAAREPHQHRAGHRSERHRRQDQMVEHVGQTAAAEQVAHAADGKPGQAYAEPEDQQDAEPK